MLHQRLLNGNHKGEPLGDAGTSPLTWSHLTRLEPRLRKLLAEARAVRDDFTTAAFCGNAPWYGLDGWRGRGFKRRLALLVGWLRPDGHPVLSGSAAYDVAYRTVYEALPDCRGACGCLWVG
jgi:hypothetical protein